ncbi:MAG: hypothetical protein E6Q97_14235 [Desulfurellales bacterium]|nr:MAG: hypothetical protein E6Q97_14235 [Desulfurellales bacterium]
MTSYQIAENVNFQTVVWTVAGAVWALVRLVTVAVGWVLGFLRVSLPAVRVLAVALGWSALLVGVVVLTAMFWHVVLCLAGIAVYAWWFRP